MRRLPWLLITSLLLAAPSARAEDRTEAIRFAHISADAAEAAMLSTVLKERFVLPEGIRAWAVDARTNSLVLTGELAAIERVRQIARLLDVAPRRLRLTVRSVRLEEAALAELRKEGAVANEKLTLIPADGESARKILDAAPTGFTSTLEMSNNRPLRLRLDRNPGEKPVALTVVPRLNGDQTITLIIQEGSELQHGRARGGGLGPQVEKADALQPSISVRRLASGQSILALGGPFPQPLVLRVEVMPDPAPAAPQK